MANSGEGIPALIAGIKHDKQFRGLRWMFWGVLGTIVAAGFIIAGLAGSKLLRPSPAAQGPGASEQVKQVGADNATAGASTGGRMDNQTITIVGAGTLQTSGSVEVSIDGGPVQPVSGLKTFTVKGHALVRLVDGHVLFVNK